MEQRDQTTGLAPFAPPKPFFRLTHQLNAIKLYYWMPEIPNVRFQAMT